MIDQILQAIQKQDPKIKIFPMKQESSSLICFYDPEFKDLPKTLIFGFNQWGSEGDFKNLLKKVEELAGQLGAEKIVGPLNYSTYLDYRLKLDHFESWFFGEPENTESEVQFLKRAGFREKQRYLSQELNLKSYSLKLFFAYYQYFKSSRLKNYTFRKASPELLSQNLPTLFALTREMFSHNFAYRDIPYELFAMSFVKSVMPQICFDSSYVVEDQTGHWVGYCLALKDPKNSERLLIKTVGVKYQNREKGQMFINLMNQSFRFAHRKYRTAVMCLMIEKNKANFISQMFSFKNTYYALFEKEVGK